MTWRDQMELSLSALRQHRLRTSLSVLGIAIGIASVIMMTSLGEGARRYILQQFTQFGTNILQVTPGKTETFGIPGVMGGTTHKLTIDDAEALRRVPGVQEVVSLAFGQARVEARGRGRSVYVFGATAGVPEMWKIKVRQGVFLAKGDPRRGAPVTVLGPGLKRELFGEENALGQFVRAAGWRLRVIGVMEPKGQFLAFDMDDLIYVPAATAMQMFDLEELLEVDVTFSHAGDADAVVAGVSRMLKERHGGNEDFTVLTQADMLETFDSIMDMVTTGVAGIAGISLVVGAIGILTMMWIAVGERTHEIGLQRALGATRAQVQRLFLIEAIALATMGGLAGLGMAYAVGLTARLLVPGLPVHTPPEYAVAAILVSVLTGLVSGVVPARRAAGLEPVDALRAE